MKIRQKLFMTGFLLIALSAAVFTAEKAEYKNDTSDSVKEPVILKLWHPWASDETAYQKYFAEVIREFNEAHNDVQIASEGIEMELYRERLPKAIASNDVPDLFFCYTDEYMARIIRSGKVLELNQYLQEDIRDRVEMTSLNGMSNNGRIYGLSYAESSGVFLVNREMFERFQVPIPEDREELLLACQEFLQLGIVPLACSGEMDHGFRLYLEALCLDRAGSAVCASVISGEASEGEEALFLEGVKDFEKLAEMGAFGDRSRPGSSSKIEEDFLRSRIPMYYTKSDFAGKIMMENSPLYGKTSVIPFPSGQGNQLFLGGISDAFVINSKTKEPRKAAASLEELMKRFSDKLNEKQAGIGTWKNLDIEEQINKKISKFSIFNEIKKLSQNATVRMQYWELMVDGRQAEKLNKSSEQLFHGTLKPEEYIAQLRKNMK